MLLDLSLIDYITDILIEIVSITSKKLYTRLWVLKLLIIVIISC